MSIDYISRPAEANLNDLMDQLKREIFLSLNCHAHATVQSFDSERQTITATINYQKTVFVSDQPGQIPVPKAVNYPVLVGCPVYFPQGGGASLTFPVAAGDQCMIAFNDRDMDNYLAAGVVSQNNTGRAHSFSDAFAFVGLNPFTKTLSNFDTARALLSKGSVAVGVGSKVLITDGTNKLGTLLENLITQMEDLCTALQALTVSGVATGLGVSGVPVNAAAFASVSTAISTISSEIGAILE